MEHTISPGTLIFVPLQRSGPEPHLAMALNAPDADGHFQLVGCSTKCYTPDWLIKLPSDPNLPNGHPRTKLKKDTWAVCDWTDDVSVADVCSTKGHVPPTVYERVVDKINEIHRLQQNPTRF